MGARTCARSWGLRPNVARWATGSSSPSTRQRVGRRVLVFAAGLQTTDVMLWFFGASRPAFTATFLATPRHYFFPPRRAISW
ncbi:MAG: hypothetical protein ACLUW6_03100 [Coriobacteriaceae bacterium]